MDILLQLLGMIAAWIVGGFIVAQFVGKMVDISEDKGHERS